MLPDRRVDKAFQRRNFLRGLLCVCIALVVSQVYPWGGGYVRLIAFIAGGIVGYGIHLVFEHLALLHYECPRCSAQIGVSPSAWPDDRPIIFFCPRCRLEWDTGLRVRQTTRLYSNSRM